MSEEEKNLITQWLQLANRLSYYNAAEGDSWHRERADREKCQREFDRINRLLHPQVIAELQSQKHYLI